MPGKPQMRDAAALMVARHHEDRYTMIGHLPQGLEGLPGDAAWRFRAVEYVAAVDDEVDFSRKRRPERSRVVGQEVVPATAPIDPWVQRQVEADVRVRKQQNPDDVAHK
jgi:hypothetical protein